MLLEVQRRWEVKSGAKSCAICLKTSNTEQVSFLRLFLILGLSLVESFQKQAKLW